MLRYRKGREPNALRAWQATPSANWGSLPAKDKDGVRKALLRDQGHLCAYCQRRILPKDGHMKVEHWHAQSSEADKKSTLRWRNLLGVCLGDEAQETGTSKGDRHCDTARGNAALFLHPVEGEGPNPRDFLRYTAEGEVLPAREPAASVRGDIEALKLNTNRLRRARVEAYEELRKRLDKKGFSKAVLGAELEAASIRPGQEAMPQCEVVRYHVTRWARKQGFQLEP